MERRTIEENKEKKRDYAVLVGLRSPVLGADIGGIPELIDAGENGELFESGNADALAGKIRALWGDRARLDAYTKACGKTRFDTVEAYAEKLMRLYQG